MRGAQVLSFPEFVTPTLLTLRRMELYWSGIIPSLRSTRKPVLQAGSLYYVFYIRYVYLVLDKQGMP